jgi:putative tryptophan/tyrosine transport system substrate-binding protein
MRRREVLTLLGAALSPLAAHGQQPAGSKRIALLSGHHENDAEGRRRLGALRDGLQALGRVEGPNLRLELRWAASDADQIRAYATELTSLKPDLILTNSTPTLAALQRATQSIPIVFVSVSDPVGDGFVDSFARPGGNITGFSNHEPTVPGKWLQLLKECAPNTVRVAAIYNPDTAPHGIFLPSLKEAAHSFAVELIPSQVRGAVEIETAVADLGRTPGGALIVMPDISNVVHRTRTIELAARQRVPALYYRKLFAEEGGLMSFGPDDVDQYRRSATYIDRILRGANPADLPVQGPSKFELVVNLKTAKALNLPIPPTLLARADEVIE